MADRRLGRPLSGPEAGRRAGRRRATVAGREDYYIAPVMPAQSRGEALEPFYASDYFEPLYEYALAADPQGQGLRLRPHARGGGRDARLARPAGAGEPLPRTARWPRASTCSSGCAPASSPTAPARCARKIDMDAPNVWLRDPVLYRIRHASHHHTGDAWCIYPMYDFAHGLSDYIEGITHSICTLEFEVHRPLYEWILEALDLPRTQPRQREFARLNVTYTVMSKRKLLRLVQEGRVQRLGRPAHAHHLGHAAARLPGRGDPRLLRAHRRGEAREHGRAGAAGALSCARTSTAAPRAPWRCCGRSGW